MAETEKTPQSVQIGGAKIQLRNVQLRADVLLDEVNLDGTGVRLDAPPAPGQPGRITTDAVNVQALMTEPNLNRLLEANLPPDVPIRNLKAVILSGKIRFSAQLVRLLNIPLSLEATPKVENGVRVYLDWQGLNAGGVPLPGALVEVLQQQLNKSFDVSKSPIPVQIDAIRCEPGRLWIIGRARITWPPVPSASVAPFSAREPQPALPAESPPVPLPAATEAVVALPAGEESVEADFTPSLTEK